MKRSDPIRAANRTVTRAVRAAEKQANFDALFRRIERAQRQAEKEAAARREAAARFARIVSASRTSKRERQAQFNRLFASVEKKISSRREERAGAISEAKAQAAERTFKATEAAGEEWEEYESSLSYERS